MIVKADRIGGAIVRRAFNRGTERLQAGKTLTRDEVLEIPANNRQSLIDNNFIDIYPPAPPPPAVASRFITSRGFGKFDVYEGRKVNEEPLTKEEAQTLVAEGAELPGENPPNEEIVN